MRGHAQQHLPTRLTTGPLYHDAPGCITTDQRDSALWLSRPKTCWGMRRFSPASLGTVLRRAALRYGGRRWTLAERHAAHVPALSVALPPARRRLMGPPRLPPVLLD